jgi:hypothetical protein
MVLDADVPLVAHDWRGQEIKIGTRILWRNRGIGKVVAIGPDYYGHMMLDIQWEERTARDRVGKIGKGINPDHCTVWPVQNE